MSNLPSEIVYNILLYTFNNIDSCLSRRFYNIKKKELTKRSLILQRWFRSYRLVNITDSMLSEDLLTKKTLIRYYMVYYPMEYLLRYPKFVVRKCEWVSPSLLDPIDADNIKKRDVYNFLYKVSRRTIEYAGW
jgi:hypothetical protein